MKTPTRKQKEGQGTVGTCINHHWHIAEQDGPTSKGTCKLCGATQEFWNSLDQKPYTFGLHLSADYVYSIGFLRKKGGREL